MLTKDGNFYDIVCEKEEDVVGNYRILCGNCQNELSLIMSITYNTEHKKAKIELCPHCKKINLVWDKSSTSVNIR